MSETTAWRRCSACKHPIALGAVFWTCSVSTCNRARTALAFCSVSCWEVHLPTANHREAWAVERRAPKDVPAADGALASTTQRRIVRPPGAAAPPRDEKPHEVLIVASRLKDYIRVASGGYNTSDRVLDPLSDIVRRICDQAIESARREGRMTVLERDIPEG